MALLLHTGIGDSYGIGFEFVKDIFIEKNHKMSCYLPHPFDTLKAGDYSDDTQMSIAVAELLLSGEAFTVENLARYFLNAYKRDSIDGYAKGFQKFLDECSDHLYFLENIINNSTRNGAAMRASSIGFVNDMNKMLKMAEINALVTHNSDEGVFSSKAIALISNFFIYDKGDISLLKDFVESTLNISICIDKNTRCKCAGYETVDAVATVLSHNDSLYGVLDHSIKMGGDTDSVAAISLGIASMSNQYLKNLPDFMFDQLRNNEYGRDYLINLDQKLMSKFLNQ